MITDNQCLAVAGGLDRVLAALARPMGPTHGLCFLALLLSVAADHDQGLWSASWQVQVGGCLKRPGASSRPAGMAGDAGNRHSLCHGTSSLCLLSVTQTSGPQSRSSLYPAHIKDVGQSLSSSIWPPEEGWAGNTSCPELSL